MMNRTLTISLLAMVVTACSNSRSQAVDATTFTNESDLIKRGKYLVTVAACNECHSPKTFTAEGRVPDPARLLSGHPESEKLTYIPKKALDNGRALWNGHSTAVAGPWGISFAANLTPDQTGIGNWSFGQFVTAIRHGKYKGLEGGRELLPPMPWRGYSHFTDDDLKAIFTYLKSLPPVSNRVPAAVSPKEMFATKSDQE